jgi:branched-chain amino acid transport system ATP-binding protein
VLIVENLNSYYDKIHILQGVNITVKQNEFVGLIGRNGVGKTTTLKSIMHLLSSQTGKVSFDGVDLSSIEPNQIQSLGIGYVPQGRGIFPTLTVKENLEISIKKKNKNNQVVEQILEQYPRLKERLEEHCPEENCRL